ncbi:MAG: chorismate synthase [Bdellovibrio sp.]|jgi:chorismate synthase
MSNSFGTHFKILSFGESHGPGLGVVIDGCPAGLEVDQALILKDLERRRPGTSALAANAVVSNRQEPDQPEILSGVFDGRTLGTPLTILVRNQDARSQDYNQFKQAPRAGHADDVWKSKFGHSDHRGGGRSSGRETLARVLGGSFAKMLLQKLAPDLRITGFSRRVGCFEVTSELADAFLQQSGELTTKVDRFSARFISPEHEKVQTYLRELQSQGESVGGVVEIRVSGVPASLGQPVFHKLKAELAAAMMSVGATSAFEMGAGIEAAASKGTDFHQPESLVYGGIRGGISTGEDLRFKVHFKPTSSILDVAKHGRHDPCIVPRAVPVIEAMTALVLADHVLWRRLDVL